MASRALPNELLEERDCSARMAGDKNTWQFRGSVARCALSHRGGCGQQVTECHGFSNGVAQPIVDGTSQPAQPLIELVVLAVTDTKRKMRQGPCQTLGIVYATESGVVIDQTHG